MFCKREITGSGFFVKRKITFFFSGSFARQLRNMRWLFMLMC